MIESLLLTAARVSTFAGPRHLTSASGFFFRRDERLYLVTSRHVLIDEPTHHFPDRVEIELHVEHGNMARSTGYSVLLYANGKSVWHQGTDSAGEIDVAVIELDRHALPAEAVLCAFTPLHLQPVPAPEVGASLLVVGFPLGFHDTLHHLPVARHAVIASSYGLRFQGHGYFLTDARTHRGTSGAPVVMRMAAAPPAEAGSSADTRRLPWALLGVHSARLDVGSRDLALDESLGLNCAWYADILMTLTRGAAPESATVALDVSAASGANGRAANDDRG